MQSAMVRFKLSLEQARPDSSAPRWPRGFALPPHRRPQKLRLRPKRYCIIQPRLPSLLSPVLTSDEGAFYQALTARPDNNESGDLFA